MLGSLGAVVAHLARDLDVRCDHRVVEIEPADRGWRVTTDAGATFEADAVVMTVPIGALQAGRVRFSPPLPAEVIAAASRIGAGRVAKVFATFDEAFWGAARAFHIAAEPPSPLALWVDVTHVIGRPALCGFATREHALAVEAMSEDQLCTLVDDVLRAVRQ